MTPTPLSFYLVGAGRVATHLGTALATAGVVCRGVWSRTASSAQRLASQIGAPHVTDLHEVWQGGASVVLIAVADPAIPSLLAGVEHCPSLVLHTAGSTPMAVLSATPHHGVLYPLQTFSHEKAVDLSAVPFCIEGNTPAAVAILRELCACLGTSQCLEVSSEQRRCLHLAAVFVCNFVNHLYALGAELVADGGLPPSLLLPLMRETLEKAELFPPATVQTGPAVRGDTAVIERHCTLLREMGKPALAEVYALLSHSITLHRTPSHE